MGFLQRLFGLENRTQGQIDFDNDLLQALIGAGAVSRETALQIPTVSGGINLIANIVSGTPIKLYRDKSDILRKLTSRKFWAAVAAFVAALIIALKGDAETAETVTGLIMAGATVIAYIVGEGLVDAEAASKKEPSLEVNLAENAALIAEILKADAAGALYNK